MPDKEFKKSKWSRTEVTIVQCGGNWAYAVARLCGDDGQPNGDIRVAKGQLKGVIDEETGAPISQVQKLNFKLGKPQQWEDVKAAVDALMYGEKES